MAINPETQYPGKIAPSDAEYPYGKARNISLPGDGTGTPWEAALVNDLFGYQQALLSEADITPTGDPDNAQESQYAEATAQLANAIKDVDVAGGIDVTVPQSARLGAVLRLTGEITGDINVILPATPRAWGIINEATGAFTITVRTAAQPGVIVAADTFSWVRSGPTGVSFLDVADTGTGVLATRVFHASDVTPLLSLDPAKLADGQQASIRDGAGQGWLLLEWDATSTETADNVDVFQITGEPVGRWLSVTREGAVRVYASEPANPPLFQMYVVSSPLTITDSGIAAGSIELVFELELDPATVTNNGDGTGSLEFYNLTTASYISGTLSTADNTTYTFAPGTALDRDDVIEVRPATSIKSATGLAYSGQTVEVPAAIDIAWPYSAGVFDNNISARGGGSLTIKVAQTFTAPGDLTLPGVDVVVRSRKDAFAGTGQLKISLVELVGGKPTGAEVASVTLADFTTAGNAYEEFNLDFDTPAVVSDGVQYGIRYEVVSPAGDCVYQMPASSASVYPGGGNTVSNSGVSGGAWQASTNDSVLRLGLV